MPAPQPGDPGSSGNPWERLAEILSQFKAILIELDAATADFFAESTRNDELRREAATHATAMGLDAGSVEEHQYLQGRGNEISDRPEFVSSNERRMNALSRVHELRGEAHTSLMRLAVRDDAARNALALLGSLPHSGLLDNGPKIIGLLEEVLDRSTEAPAPAGVSPGVRAHGVTKRSQYEAIDKLLREIDKMGPGSYDEVVANLDGRVKIPSAEPFMTAGGWVKGFRKNPPTARAWLSKRWKALGLTPFRRGQSKLR